MTEKMLRNRIICANGGSAFYAKIVKLLSSFLLIIAMTAGSAFAQFEVSGTVIDEETEEPLTGVNIVIQGTSTGTATDIDGNYSLEVPSLDGTLVVTYIGYIRQEIPIDERTEIDIVLAPDRAELDDIVVVGYGTQEERQITGSISSVSADEFTQGNVNNPGELIQGKVPGLNISTEGGNPNGDPTFRLRGVSSFSNNEPLIVVDGIIGASLENIDPNDIASIDVLKDASASAIYGTRGGAGVIAITTKKGAADGTTNVSYSGSVSSIGVENKVDVLSADQFRQLGQDVGIEISDFGQSTDWFDEITQNSYSTIHNLSISGGNQSTTYRVSGNFRDNQGLMKTTGFQQTGGRVNLNHYALNDKLNLTFNLSATNRSEEIGFGEAFRYAVTFNPTAPVTADGFDNTGGYREIDAFDMFNPVAILKTASNTLEEKRYDTSLKADYDFSDIIPGLGVSAFYSLQNYAATQVIFHSRQNKLTGGATTSALGRGQAERDMDEHRFEQFDFTANYISTLFEGVDVEALAGYSYLQQEYEGTEVIGGDFISDGVNANNLNFAQDFDNGLGTINSFKNDNKLIAGFGRLNLNLDNTYFLNGTIRREASTRFGVNEKWGNFWSVGGSVEAMNLIEVDFIDRLKIRASYGETGQDAPFDGISKLRFAPTGNFFVGGSFVQSFGPVNNSNPDLKWEETREFNVGVDFDMLDERLSGSFEFYDKVTDDLILEIAVPVPPNLYPTSWLNVGSISSTGLEATLGYDLFRGRESYWNTGFTFSTINLTLEEFESDIPQYRANVGSPGQNNTQMVRVAEGEPLGQIWGPKFVEIGDDGIWRFEDADGNLVTSDEISREDEQVIGNGVPDFELGWTNRVTYKNWDLNLFVRGVFGHDLVNIQRVFFENPSNISTYNVTETALDLTNLTSSPVYNSFHVEDASFVRFENLSIGYTVPLPENTAVRNLRFSLSGRNLFTLTGYDGVDPEVRWEDNLDPANPDPLAIGIERRTRWYTARSITFGVNLDF
jgi:iron complex outermembrane receptor protein